MISRISGKCNTALQKLELQAEKRNVIENLYLIVLGLYLLKLSFDTTLFQIAWPRDYEWVLFILTTGVVMLKIGYSEKSQGIRWLFCVLAGIAFGLSWWHTEFKYLFLAYIPILMIGAIGVDYRKILRLSFWINFSTLLLAFLGSCTGVLEDLVYGTDGNYRHSFGIVYTTDFAARVFYLLVVFWVLYEKLSPVITMILTVVLSVFVYYNCKAKTTTLTLICFLAAIVYYCITENVIAVKGEKTFIKWLDKLLMWSMPFFALIMIFLTMKYDENIEWISRLDRMLTSRLSLGKQGIENYGFSFFGTAFDQIGSGGTVAHRLEYNFIDSSYVLIMLRYGIITLGVILFVHVLLAYRAVEKRHKRIVIALFIIGIQSVMEHHLSEINYNIFMILPFAAINQDISDFKQQLQQKEQKKSVWKGIGILITGIAVTWAVLPRMISVIKTLVTLLRLNQPEKHIYYIGIMAAGVAFGVLLLYLLWQIGRITKEKTVQKKQIFLAGGMIFLAAVAAIKMNNIIENGIREYVETLDAEDAILEQITEECDEKVKVYVDDMPEVYHKYLKIGRNRVLPIEFCTAEKDVVIITPKAKEAAVLFYEDYYFGELSDVHGVYTNNAKVIQILENNGIDMMPCYSVLRSVDLQEMAQANGLEMTEDGGLLLHGTEKSIYHGPWMFSYTGRVRVEFEVQLLNHEAYQGEDVLGTTKISSNSGQTVWNIKEMKREQLDAAGYGIIRNETNFYVDVNNVEFLVLLNDGVDLEVKSITFYKVVE